MLMGCLWVWPWTHFFVKSSCRLATVVISGQFADADFEVLRSFVALPLLYREALCLFHHMQ